MALKYKTRRWLSLIVLLIGLPAYVFAAVTILNQIDRPAIWLELLIYLALGLLWAIPLRFVFLGVGKADPDAPPEDEGR